MNNIYIVLEQRGFVKQTTSEDLHAILAKPVTCYAGFDPTAESLHVGSLMPIMALAHMQRCGHRPIALVGGATAMIGDPSGKDKVRSMLTMDEIAKNIAGIQHQLSRFIDFSEGKALLVNNADWISTLEYISFIRDIGVHFSVNRMLTAECFRARMEKEAGLSFLELNYMLLQAYDFLHLYRTHECVLQIGGDDQWSNILAGGELIRRTEQGVGLGLTLPLIVTATGAKMGKTEKGALWLDEDRCSINDFYQYWRNADDRDVNRFMKFFTYRDVAEIDALTEVSGLDLNKIKTIMAHDITSVVHNKDKARKALITEKEIFGIPDTDWNYIADKVGIDTSLVIESTLPHSDIKEDDLRKGTAFIDILVKIGLTKSLGEARRMIKQGGAYVNRVQQKDVQRVLKVEDVVDGAIELRLGKKKHHVLNVI